MPHGQRCRAQRGRQCPRRQPDPVQQRQQTSHPVVASTQGRARLAPSPPLTFSSPYIPFLSIGSMLRNQCSFGCVRLTHFPISNFCKKLLAIGEAFTILWLSLIHISEPTRRTP